MNDNFETRSLSTQVCNVESYVESIIQDVEAQVEFSEYTDIDIEKFFEIKKTRNIDYKNEPPIEVVVKNKINGICIPVDYVTAMKECEPEVYKYGKMNTIMKQLDYHNLAHLILFSDYFYKSIKKGQPVYRHEKLGLDTLNDERIFKLYNVINDKGQLISSEYSGSVKLKQEGTKQEYIDGIRKLVIGNERLELMLCCSVTGILNKIMQISDANIVLNFTAQSGSGKTVSSKLALSMFGLASNFL